MVSAGLQMLGTALGIVGWIGAIVVCAIPMWKVTAFNGIVGSQTLWEGIWMSCNQSTDQMHCKVYDSTLELSPDLQAARALTIAAIVVGVVAILLSVAGGKCTNCVEDEASKAKLGVASGGMFIVAGVLLLVPVFWTAQTIISDSTLMDDAQWRDYGAAIYIGWVAGPLMLIGGSVLCLSFNSKKKKDRSWYKAVFQCTSKGTI